MMTRPSQTTIIFMMFAVLTGPCTFVLATNATERSLTTDYSTAKQIASSGIAEDLTTTTTTSSIHTTAALSTTPTHTTSPPSTLPLTKISSEPLTTSTPSTLEEESASAPPLSTTQASVPESTTPVLSPSSTMETVTSVNTILTGQTRTSSSTTTSFISTTSSSQQTSSVTKSLTNCKTPSQKGYRFPSNATTTYGSSVTVNACAEGYNGTPNISIRCQSDGTWTNASGCTIVHCQRPSQKGYSFPVDAETTYEGSIIVNACAEGYRGTPNTSIQCQANSTWTSASGCTMIDCGRISEIENRNITFEDGTIYNRSAYVKCNTGFILNGSSSIICLDTGQWSEIPHCKLKEVKLNESCQPDLHQCKDNNTECIKETGIFICKCTSKYYSANGTCNLRPPFPNITLRADDINTRMFTIRWIPTSEAIYDHEVFKIQPALTNRTTSLYRKRNDSNSAIVINNLHPGTQYAVSISICRMGIQSAENYTLHTYTKPLEPASLNVTHIHERNASIEWTNDVDGNYTSNSLTVDEVKSNSTVKQEINLKNRTSEFIGNLIGGTKYTVRIYAVVPGLKSDPKEFTFYTVPEPLNDEDLNISQLTNRSFILHLNKSTTTLVDHYFISLNPSDTIGQTNWPLSRDFNQTTISNLKAGSKYMISVETVLQNRTSELSAVKIVYTRPKSPENITVNFNFTNEILLRWPDNRDNKTTSTYKVRLKMSSILGELLEDVTNNSNITSENVSETVEQTRIQHLTPGRWYCVSVVTVLKLSGYDPLESFINTFCDYTRPIPPTNVTITSRTKTTMNLKLPPDRENMFDQYVIKYNQNTSVEERSNESSTEIKLDSLKPGTLYHFEVFTTVGGDTLNRRSLTHATTHGYTIPSEVLHRLDGSSINSSALNVSWSPGDGSFTSFHVEPYCHDAYDEEITTVEEKFVNITYSLINGLSPGAYCSFGITTVAGDQNGNQTILNLGTRTQETAPTKVVSLRVENITDDAESLRVSWDRPSNPVGVVRQYILYIRSSKTCAKIVLNCSDCNNDAPPNCMRPNNSDDAERRCEKMLETSYYYNQSQISYVYMADTLTAYTSYNVSIQASTRCHGLVAKHGPVRTDEAVPGSPLNFNATSVSANDIFLQWDSPKPVTGNITAYNVTYRYDSYSCGPSETIRAEAEIVSGTENKFHITELRPFWTYRIRIVAATSKGYGQFTKELNITTDESYPGKINESSLNASTTASSVDLLWGVPCNRNGRIQGYDVYRLNQDNPTDSRLYIINSSSTFLNMTKGILPYRNYTLEVKARTSVGAGNYTKLENVTTKTAVPHQPKTVIGCAESSKSMNVSWKPPNLYTGVTKYMVEARDVADNSFVKTCISSGFNSTTCLVDQLDEYWDYTLRVTASTAAGNTSTNYTKAFKTQEDKPGEVSLISLAPQTDVKLERSINVSWEEPLQRDLNGIIMNYTIKYTVDGTNYTVALNNNHTFHYELKDNIKPGIVTVQIVAATSIGYGKPRNENTRVQPGAVLKPNETVKRVVQPSSVNIDDKERHIGVTLQLQSFLCNSNNGQPTQWGVIVAQDALALDDPFYGTSDEYEIRLKAYKHWSEIKDKDKIPPYRATNSHWNPCISFRKRRSASQEQDSTFLFIVGKDGDCVGIPNNLYCNGQLQPGRSYRVKSFVCTEAGCTESKYSQPIKTAPDLTVPIVAGVVSGIVVVAAILVVVFLKRRGKVCFAKDMEQHATFERPESLELTKSSKFRPRSIKLADFPAFVENMQKDSGLLFADAFRLLKDQSPSHPCATAETQACRLKTRYTNILPFDHSRTKLLPLDDEEGSDFINANYIPGYTSRREYIATQGPLPATKDDFWRMVWEQRVDIIVMLTRCMEKGKRKCDQYWPEVVQEPVYSGDLIINIQSESVLSDYIIRIIEVKLKDESRLVRHLAFQKWPDMGSPDDTDMLLNFVKAVRQFRPPNSKCPMVVHCSAGVGRTGTFIAVDHILQHIRDHDEVDVYSIILDMRNYRCNMVQTEDQFVYIHECVRDFITMDEQDDEEEEEEHLYENTSGRDNIYENTAFQQD